MTRTAQAPMLTRETLDRVEALVVEQHQLLLQLRTRPSAPSYERLRDELIKTSEQVAHLLPRTER